MAEKQDRLLAPQLYRVKLPSGNRLLVSEIDIEEIKNNKVNVAELFNSASKDDVIANFFSNDDIQSLISWTNEIQATESNKPVGLNTPIGQRVQQKAVDAVGRTEKGDMGSFIQDKVVNQPVSNVSKTIVAKDIPVEGQAILNVISGHESADDYNVIVGQGKAIPGAPASFDDYSQHPRVIGMRTEAGPSTAAGRYQITATTWDDVSGRYKELTDFSPGNQDKAAWILAQERYKANTGSDLLTDLQSKKYGRVRDALQDTWLGLVNKDIQGELTNILGQ